jgi:23S rRNA pseudouridine2605 synthase
VIMYQSAAECVLQFCMMIHDLNSRSSKFEFEQEVIIPDENPVGPSGRMLLHPPIVPSLHSSLLIAFQPLVSVSWELKLLLFGTSIYAVAADFAVVTRDTDMTVSASKMGSKVIIPTLLRLSKLVSDTGVCSRRTAEKWIAAGRVSIDKVPVKIMSYTAKSDDKVYLDGQLLEMGKFTERPRLWAVNKLKGEVLAQTDTATRPLLMDRLRTLMDGKLAPSLSGLDSTDVDTLKTVSWLDYRTEGLCLITNNAQLAKIMGSVESGLHRTYRVRVHGLITESKLSGLRRGMLIDGIKYKPMDVSIERTMNTITWMNVKVSETRPRLITNIFKALHLTPLRIICTEFGSFQSSKILPPGTEYSEIQIEPQILRLLRDK